MQCPSNPHHWILPSSLFLHSLHCPSEIDVNPLLATLQYPRTLKSEQQLNEQNKFVQPFQDPTAELCFSLDDYVDFNSNFFYQHCPGVVSLSGHDASHGRIFTLPGVLSIECANFVCHDNRKTEGFQCNSVKFLPSELRVIRRDAVQWNDFPNAYPYIVLKALSCLDSAKECEVSMWLIVNSPRFGVVIDVPMRDHMLVLFRLCLKAMFREALHSHKSSFRGEMGDNGVRLNPKSLNFKCPVLVEVLRWLSSQLSILYGETNAKSFIVTMLKHLLPKVASQASFFPLNRETDQTSVSGCKTNISTSQPCGKIMDKEGDDKAEETMFIKPIFVYQIAAAIAALHERSLLEARIKALRMPMPLTSYQRSVEHAHLSMKADEERRKRLDYRPLIEHDGLPLQRQHDEESNKAKTREEILAEERDYKRRRMSYRGKKLKRTTKEVMRDIIEEYMEAITRAGGIGCLTKEDEGPISTFKTYAAHDSTNFKLNDRIRSGQYDGRGKMAQNDHGFEDGKAIDASPSRYNQQEIHSHGRFEDQGPNSDRNEREYHSRSPSSDRRYGRSKEHRSHRRKHDITEMTVNEHSKRNRSSNTFRHLDCELQYSTSSGLSISSGRKDRKKLDSPERYRQRKQNYGEPDSFRKNEFNDRYDPSNASDVYDDQYDDCKYTRHRS